jgi:hypothetical protein
LSWKEGSYIYPSRIPAGHKRKTIRYCEEHQFATSIP